MKELTLIADIDGIEAVTDFVNENLEAADCSMKAQMQIDIAIDELFGNIAHYAYEGGEGKGEATVGIEISEDGGMAEIVFSDGGIPYNPLAKEDPDVTLSAEERKIGGLGIFMVKKTMDDMAYEYKDGKNILTIKKKIK